MGLPERIRCDNGPQFRGPFKQMCEDFKVIMEHSSPYNPASNGAAEKGLGILKKLLKKCSESGESFDKAFNIYRDTPKGDCEISPSRLFFRRQRRLEGMTNLKDNFDEILLGERLVKKKMEDKAKRNEKVKALGIPKCTELKVGKKVLLQDERTKLWDHDCVILEVHPRGLSAVLECCDTKKQYHRSRRMMMDALDQEEENLIEALACEVDSQLRSCLKRRVSADAESCAWNYIQGYSYTNMTSLINWCSIFSPCHPS